MTPDRDIARAFEATWPPVEQVDIGAFRVGRGMGGGGRVSSARALSPDWAAADFAQVERVQQGWNEPAMFRVADDDRALQAALAARGYAMQIPTAIMAADCAALMHPPLPPLSGFAIWPPLAIQRAIWAEGNIAATRQAVMDRVAAPKTALLGRHNDRAAGAAFVAVEGSVAMIHGIEVVPGLRRQGVAGRLLQNAAAWAADQGALRLGLAVSRANVAARALYERAGFVELGGYGYWTRA